MRRVEKTGIHNKKPTSIFYNELISADPFPQKKPFRKF
jgi:hypothetical protein